MTITSITITEKHIALLKEFRFAAAQPHLQAREKGLSNAMGWLKSGQKLNFRGESTIEPYAAIYAGPYQGGKGAGKSSGFCSIGALSYSHSALPDKMNLGRYCSIGEGLKILDSHHPVSNISTSHFTWRTTSPAVQAVCNDFGMTMPEQPEFPINGYKPFPVIRNDVWIGQNVTLSMGIEIGNGAVVAANSVVTKSVPDYAIVGGNPARIIKYRFTDAQIEELQQLQWWNYLFCDFSELDLQVMDNFIPAFKLKKESLNPYVPKKLTLPEDFQ